MSKEPAEDAVTALGRFDGEVGAVAAPFSVLLLRSESVASSAIEQLTATVKNIALAELGREVLVALDDFAVRAKRVRQG